MPQRARASAPRGVTLYVIMNAMINVIINAMTDVMMNVMMAAFSIRMLIMCKIYKNT